MKPNIIHAPRMSALLLAALTTFAGDRALAQVASAPPVHGNLRMVLLDAAEATWTPVPRQLVLPIGAKVMFEYVLDQPHLVTWSGATLTDLGNYSSRAAFAATEVGSRAVTIEAVDPAGAVLERIHENVQVLTAEDLAVVMDQGIVDASGAVIDGTRPEPAGGDTKSLTSASHGGPLAGWVLGGAGPVLGGAGAPILKGGGGGGGGGYIKPCHDGCKLEIVQVVGAYPDWTVSFTLENTGNCTTSYKIFGTPDVPGQQWAATPVWVLQLAPGGSANNNSIAVHYNDTDPNTIPVGYQFFTLYSIGSHTPTSTAGMPPNWNCSKVVSDVNVCFQNCGGGG